MSAFSDYLATLHHSKPLDFGEGPDSDGGFLVPLEVGMEIDRLVDFCRLHPELAARNIRALEAAARHQRRFTPSYPWRRWNRRMPDFARRGR